MALRVSVDNAETTIVRPIYTGLDLIKVCVKQVIFWRFGLGDMMCHLPPSVQINPPNAHSLHLLIKKKTVLQFRANLILIITGTCRGQYTIMSNEGGGRDKDQGPAEQRAQRSRVGDRPYLLSADGLKR